MDKTAAAGQGLTHFDTAADLRGPNKGLAWDIHSHTCLLALVVDLAEAVVSDKQLDYRRTLLKEQLHAVVVAETAQLRYHRTVD